VGGDQLSPLLPSGDLVPATVLFSLPRWGDSWWWEDTTACLRVAGICHEAAH
jgi:hypothetical protein